MPVNPAKYRMDLLVFCNQLNMIGVRYLSSFLKSKGVDVRIVYMISQADSFVDIFSDRLYEEIIKFCSGSSIIGLSLTTNYFPEARKLSTKLRSRLGIPIVWGGVHPTVEADEGLEYADYVIRGEGESATYELIKAIVEKKDVSQIKNLAFKRNEVVIKNDLRPLEDLDNLPLPDLDFTSHYLVDEDRLKPVTVDLMKKHMFTFSNKKMVTYNISTTRGCPHSCTYCINYVYRQMLGEQSQNYLRKRGIERVLEELREAIKRYPFIEYIFIADETFFIQKAEVIKRFAEIYKKDIGLPLKIEFSPQTFNGEKLKYMIDAGAVELHMGVESGSDDTNYNIYHRRFPVNRIKGIIDALDKESTSLEVVHLHILICNPFEKLRNTKDTFRFLAGVPNKFHIRFFPLVLFPGTKLLVMAEEAGMIKDKEKDVYLKTWSLSEALNSADYYTICAVFLQKFKNKLRINQSLSLLFYYLMSFPLVKVILGGMTGKKILIWFYFAAQGKAGLFKEKAL